MRQIMVGVLIFLLASTMAEATGESFTAKDPAWEIKGEVSQVLCDELDPCIPPDCTTDILECIHAVACAENEIDVVGRCVAKPIIRLKPGDLIYPLLA